eukprot:1112473-Pleurochrysis_carterae.AAC.1
MLVGLLGLCHEVGEHTDEQQRAPKVKCTCAAGLADNWRVQRVERQEPTGSADRPRRIRTHAYRKVLKPEP